MSRTRTGAELFADALQRYGASYVFGNPGTTELPVVHAIEQSEALEYVLAPHEDVAVGMAAGYASTRRYHADVASESDETDGVPAPLPLGVANLHLTAGVAHGLGNLYGAAMAGAPVLVTAGNHSETHRHREPILSGDLVGMTEQFTKWSAGVSDPDAIPRMVRRAVRTALTPPTGPVFLALPLDVALAETDAESKPLGRIPTPGHGEPGAVTTAAELLVEADDVVLVVGDGVARSGTAAVDAAVDLAEAAGARVHGEILACEVNFPTDHEQFVGVIPPNAHRVRLAMDADAICLLGCSTNTTLTDPGEPLVSADTACVHVGVDPEGFGKRQPIDAAVVGDPGAIAADFAALLDTTLDESTRDARLAAVLDWVESDGTGDRPSVDATEGDPRPTAIDLADAMAAVADDAFVVDEGVTAKYALFERMEFDYPEFLSNKGGGLGYGLPAAVGAAIAEREFGDPRDVVAFVGDGSYLYYPNAIYPAVREGLDLTVVVADNRGYSVVAEGAAEMLDAETGATASYASFDPPVDLAANAESYGARGDVVDSVAELEPALSEAIPRHGTDVVDVLLDDGGSDLR